MEVIALFADQGYLFIKSGAGKFYFKQSVSSATFQEQS